MTKKYNSAAFAAIHETMAALHEIGAVSEQTMRDFDATCLTPIQQFTPEQVRDRNLP